MGKAVRMVKDSESLQWGARQVRCMDWRGRGTGTLFLGDGRDWGAERGGSEIQGR